MLDTQAYYRWFLSLPDAYDGSEGRCHWCGLPGGGDPTDIDDTSCQYCDPLTETDLEEYFWRKRQYDMLFSLKYGVDEVGTENQSCVHHASLARSVVVEVGGGGGSSIYIHTDLCTTTQTHIDTHRQTETHPQR
jgi:hypothetical protein